MGILLPLGSWDVLRKPTSGSTQGIKRVSWHPVVATTLKAPPEPTPALAVVAAGPPAPHPSRIKTHCLQKTPRLFAGKQLEDAMDEDEEEESENALDAKPLAVILEKAPRKSHQRSNG